MTLRYVRWYGNKKLATQRGLEDNHDDDNFKILRWDGEKKETFISKMRGCSCNSKKTGR